MFTEDRPLTKRERTELAGYVSRTGMIGRAVLFVIAIAIVAAVARRVQAFTPLTAPVWIAVPLIFGSYLYVVAGRWTGGTELRRAVRLDLEGNVARVYRFRCSDVIVFEENEDEGPVVFVETTEGETLVFTGQDLARQVKRGFPWREFELRVAPHSQQFLGFGERGDPHPPSAVRQPLSRQVYTKLQLGKVRHWGKLDIPFAEVREVSSDAA